MGTVHVSFSPTRLIFILTIIAPFVSLTFAVETNAKARPPLVRPLEVTITESFGKKFALEKPPIPLSMPLEALWPAPDSAFVAPGAMDMGTEETLLQALNYPPSAHIAKPWLPEIPESPVARFFLKVPSSMAISSWELQILDSQGRLASSQRFSGRPPEGPVEWDGRSLAGEPAQVGRPYTYRIKLVDTYGKTQFRMGKSFELPALQYFRQDHRIFEIALDRLFTHQKSSLLSSGSELLSRALEAIVELGTPVYRLELCDDAPQMLLHKRLKALGLFVAREMQSPPENIALKTSSYLERGKILRIEIAGQGNRR